MASRSTRTPQARRQAATKQSEAAAKKAEEEAKAEEAKKAEEEAKAAAQPGDDPTASPETTPDAPETDEQDEQAPEGAPAPVRAPEGSPADVDPEAGTWTTDRYGNPTNGAMTVQMRNMQPGAMYYPFEYEDVDPDAPFVRALEDVYQQIKYMGSDRPGKVWAYFKGGAVPRSALEHLIEEDEGDDSEVEPE